MTKNYFTDEQVKELAIQICEVTNKQTHDCSPIYEFTENRLKALMNLAVETAIGEPKAQAYINFQNECEQIDWFEGQYIKVDYEFTPLYSVKELEN